MKIRKPSPFSYQWVDRDGVPLDGQTAPTLNRDLLPVGVDASGVKCLVSRKPEVPKLPEPIIPELSNRADYKFHAHIERAGPDECWNWKGATAEGYGRFKYRGKVYGAHRVAYAVAHGDIPKGLLVMHACDNPPCCNPAHLKVGTYRDNARDMAEKGRSHAQNKNRTRTEMSTNGS